LRLLAGKIILKFLATKALRHKEMKTFEIILLKLHNVKRQPPKSPGGGLVIILTVHF